MNLCADFISAGKDLAALRKKQECDKKEATAIDMDLLFGTSETKSKSKKKQNKSQPKKAKKPKYDDACEVMRGRDHHNLDSSSDDAVEKQVAAALLQRAKTEQQNINRYYREQRERSLDQSFKLYQTFEGIFRTYAKKEQVPIEKVHMELVGDEEEYRIIKPSYTPDDLNIRGIALLEGCLMNIESKKIDSEDEDDFIDDDKIELKMQLKGRRDRLTVRMGPQETFKLAMLKLADQISQPVEKLKFHFDGEVVQNTQTPEDLDLEGGEVFDVEIL